MLNVDDDDSAADDSAAVAAAAADKDSVSDDQAVCDFEGYVVEMFYSIYFSQYLDSTKKCSGLLSLLLSAFLIISLHCCPVGKKY